MLKRFAHRNLTWIDLEKPTREEIASVIEEFHIHPALADELIQETLRPKAELYGNAVYLVMHFPYNISDPHRITEREIDFIIGKNFIITAHMEDVDAIYEFQKMFRVSSILTRRHVGDHGGHLFYSLMKILYEDLEARLEGITFDIKKIEHNIFENKEALMVREISETHRRILDIKQTIRFHAETLRSFGIAGRQLFGNDNESTLESITTELGKVTNTLASQKELLIDLKETNDSLLSTKTNEVMKFLTFITFTTLPFTLIASILGMNSRFTTDISMQTVIIMFGAAALFGIGVYLYFRKRTWL